VAARSFVVCNGSGEVLVFVSWENRWLWWFVDGDLRRKMLEEE